MMFWLGFCCCERYHDPGDSYKGNHLTGVALQFRGAVHDLRGGEHGSRLIAMVLERWLRALHLDPQAAVH